LLQKLLCWTPNMRGGSILGKNANATDAASTMVSTLSSGGGLTSLTTTFLSLKIHTDTPGICSSSTSLLFLNRSSKHGHLGSKKRCIVDIHLKLPRTG